MPAHVGKDPRWFEPVDLYTKTGRQRKEVRRGNMTLSLSDGWHEKRPRGWATKGMKSMIDGKPMVEKRRFTGYDGKEYEIYKTRGYEDRIAFSPRGDDEALKFASYIFDKNNPEYDVIEKKGKGHIRTIAYSYKGQILRVEFDNNDAICLFFTVPYTIGGQLLKYAESDATRPDPRGISRHILGIMFWRLVRIKGQVRGANFPFEYERRGNYRLTKSNKRYTIVLSDANVKQILGYRPPNFKPGMKISTIVSEEEYMKYAPIIDTFEHRQAEERTKTTAYTDKDGNEVEREQVTQDYMDSFDEWQHREQADAELRKVKAAGPVLIGNPELKQEEEAFADLKAQYDKANEAHKQKVVLKRRQEQHDIEKRVQQENAELFSTYEDLVRAGEMTRDEYQQILQNTAESAGAPSNFYDRRFKAGNSTPRKWVEKVRNMPKRDAFDSYEDYLEYVRLDKRTSGKLNEYANRSAQVVKQWTPEDLIEMSNPTLPNGRGIPKMYADEYKGYIRRKDYRGAFDFLRGKWKNLYDSKTGKFVKRVPLLGEFDEYKGD